MIDEILEHLNFMIDNQDELEKEGDGMPFPEWNKGYREALTDIKQHIEQNQFDADYDEDGDIAHVY